MKKIFLFLFSLIILGCTRNINYVGKYMKLGNPNYLHLRKDSTYIYEYRSLHLYQQSIGKWLVKSNNEIVLNSSKTFSLDLNYNYLNNLKFDSTQINVNFFIENNKNLSNYKCTIVINNLAFKTISCDNTSLITVPKVKEIYFILDKRPIDVNHTFIPIGLKTKTIRIDSLKRNNLSFDIFINDNQFYYRVFNNEILKTGTNTLRNKLFKKITKVSDSLNIFSRYKDSDLELKPLD